MTMIFFFLFRLAMVPQKISSAPKSVKSVRRNHRGRVSHRSHRSPQILAFAKSYDRKVTHLCRSVKSVRNKKAQWGME